MANSRMYLVHRPSRVAVYLGKRMGWGWYDTPPDLAAKIDRLFDRAESECTSSADGDDFCIVFEAHPQRLPELLAYRSVKDAGDGLLILEQE